MRATYYMPYGGSGRKSGARGDLPPAEPGPQPSDRRDPNSLIIRISSRLGVRAIREKTGPYCRNNVALYRKQQQAARAQLQAAQGRIARLESRLETLLRTLFGRKSEKPDEPPGKEDGTDGDGKPADEEQGGESADEEQDGKQEEERPRKPRKQRGRKPGTPAPQRVDRSKVPVKVELLDVPEAERKCRYCGKAYVRSGCRTSWIYELEWQAVACLIRRLIYRPACACEEARTLTAPPAPRLGERTQLGTTVWAWGIVQVFALFRPQAAVARDLTALGLPLPVSTLSQGLRRLAALFEPLDAAIRERQAQAAVAQADETSWPVEYIEGQANGKQPPASGGKPLHWLWVCLTADTVRTSCRPGARRRPGSCWGAWGGGCTRGSLWCATAGAPTRPSPACWGTASCSNSVGHMLRSRRCCAHPETPFRNLPPHAFSRNIIFRTQSDFRKAISPLSFFHGRLLTGSAASQIAVAFAFVCRSTSA